VDENGAEQVFDGAKLFLAAGVLNTAEIMLRSLGQESLEIKDSQYFIFPLLQRKASPDVLHERLHTLAQAFLEIDDTAISPYGVHLQVYGYNDILSATLDAKLGRLRRFFPAGMLLDRMLIVQGYLHSAHSGKIKVRLSNGVLTVTPTANAESREKIQLVLRKMTRLAPALQALPIGALLQITEPGRGFHAGGSFPMARGPKAGESDTLGRPKGMRRIHIVDASVFPSIPATTITLTVMANAYRIGQAAAREASGE
jgi:choline dehydrogenase-like flavoprotein